MEIQQKTRWIYDIPGLTCGEDVHHNGASQYHECQMFRLIEIKCLGKEDSPSSSLFNNSKLNSLLCSGVSPKRWMKGRVKQFITARRVEECEVIPRSQKFLFSLFLWTQRQQVIIIAANLSRTRKTIRHTINTRLGRLCVTFGVRKPSHMNIEDSLHTPQTTLSCCRVCCLKKK